MVMISFFKLTEEIFLFRTEGGMYMVLPQCCSQHWKDCRQDSEDYLNSGHTLLLLHLGQIYTLLHLSDIHILKILA